MISRRTQNESCRFNSRRVTVALSPAIVVWTPRSCDLTLLNYYLWGVVKDKCYTGQPEANDALKNIILEAIGETQLPTIENVLKNWTDRVGYSTTRRGSSLNEIISHYKSEGFYFQIKKEI